MNRLTSLALLAALAVPAGARACPVCDTETGREVRAGVFDANFSRNVVAVLSPFPILGGIVAFIHFGGRDGGGGGPRRKP